LIILRAFIIQGGFILLLTIKVLKSIKN